ncbi:hypothetical protein [Pseudonocardia sp. H11422]|uniref:hypothetical protein n=1 Tax=Pseudonocardia sp. H11422 TaxID=2835866 RepID=UPI001BDBEE5F|nr:hypothetical protein [Pseudonocardia sp. H11422]
MAVWLTVSVVVAVFLGRAIRLRDRQVPRSDDRIPRPGAPRPTDADPERHDRAGADRAGADQPRRRRWG